MGISISLLFFSACGGGGNSENPASTPTAETGSIGFSVEWQGTPLSTSDSSILGRSAELNCSASGIYSVSARVYDESNSLLASGEWSCNAHSGTITGIRAGSNRALVILGKDSQGNNIFLGGPVRGITIVPNQTYNAGTITASPYSINLVSPASDSSIVNCDFSFNWSGAVGSKFEIQIDDNLDFASPTLTQTLNENSYTPVNLYPAKYYWRVRASDSLGNSSGWSETWNCTVLNATGQPPLPPAGVTVTGGDGQVTITWESVPGAARYDLYWSTSPDVSKASFTEKISNVISPFTHGGRTNGTNYYYILTSVNNCGESSASSRVSIMAGQIPPVPAGVSVLAGDGQVAISWNAIAGATYNLYWGTVSGINKTTGTKIPNVITSPYTHTGLVNGTTYYYVVTAQNALGESSESSQVSATPGRPPSAPTGVSATAGNAQVILNWQIVSGATRYDIYWATSPQVSKNFYTEKIPNVSLTGTFIHTGRTNGTTYYYVVTASNSYGESGESTAVSATPGQPPPAPTGVSATGGDRQVILTWGSVSGTTSYNLYWGTAPGVTKATGTKISGIISPSYTHVGRTNGSTYYYVVTAVNSYGESSESTEVSATPGQPPSAPTGVSAAAGDRQVTLTWGSVSGATSYNVYWSTAPGVTKATGTKISGIISPSYTHVGRTNGTTYYYVITAVNSYGESNESTEVSATPGQPPSPPTGVSAAPGNKRVTISWASVSGATSYNLYWSTVPGVTKQTGTKIPGVISPYAHTGRTNGTTYYYVVTAVNSYGESDGSTQVSARPN